MLNRWLKNPLIDPVQVMCGFIPKLIEQACMAGKTAVLRLDQSKVGDGYACLMLSMWLGERAISLAWHVAKTCGNIGFKAQKPLLDRVLTIIPSSHNIMLTADRFYATARLVGWCQGAGWNYRLRLKSNLILHHDGAEIVTGEIANFCPERDHKRTDGRFSKPARIRNYGMR